MSRDISGGEDVIGTRGIDPAGTGTHTSPRLVERILVKKVNQHYYNISIRTRPVKRELFGRHGKAGYPEMVPVGIDGGGA